MKKKIHFFTLTLLFSISCYSQFSKTHYIPPLCGASSVPADAQYLYISTPSITPVNFKINRLGGTPIVGTVARDTPYIHNAMTDVQFLVSESNVNNILNDGGYIVEADDVVYVTLRTIAGGYFQAGALVSKGLAALGTQFRVGAMVNVNSVSLNNNYLTFVSVLATENNTIINFTDIKPGVSLLNNAGVGSFPSSVTLNTGQSFVMAVKGNSVSANKDGLIGCLVSSNKPIAVNCGSYAGNNGDAGNIDLGFDQIVSAERLVSGGTVAAGNQYSEYIFVRGRGQNAVERPLIVCHENNTEIFLNGSATPAYTRNAGEYVALTGVDFSANNNLYVKTSKPTFAYQSIGDDVTSSQANQEMFFVPPLSCQTPREINNVPQIENIGPNPFTGRVTIVTKTGSTLDFIINGVSYSYATLPATIVKVGPNIVPGNSNYVTYSITGLTGNVSCISSSELYLAAYGTSGAATFGGFYSGFTFKPEISLQPIVSTISNCIPNVQLKVSSLSSFNVFQWYFNGTAIAGATSPNYTPTSVAAGGKGPGYYYVEATLTVCSLTLKSDEIPVSQCPTNFDNDLANDNIDIDLDNDGITNCTESLGNLPINSSVLTGGNINTGTYNNSFTGIVSTGGTTTPFGTITGNINGDFVSQVPPGKDSSVTYSINFANPISVSLQYVNTALSFDLANSNANFKIKCPINKTITVLNPSNQLLIDTNYDGIYESGVLQYSSFEIRFRINGSTPLPAGTGTFSFRTYLTNSLSFTHTNLSDTVGNKATFNISSTCIPLDTDNDGIVDQIDLDSDNDGILDFVENQGNNFPLTVSTDANSNGMLDNFETLPATYPWNSDTDTVKNYLDLDSDNDGIYDLVEAGSAAIDANFNGIIDGLPASFGINGLSDSIETAIDSGVLNYTLRNTDGLFVPDYLDLDSDEDFCSDIIEAGFLDPDNDNYLGNSPVSVNTNGIVTSAVGYTTPNTNYITQAVITITNQPASISTCELQSPASFSVTTNAVNGYQWQLSTNGGTTWNNLSNVGPYSNVTTATLNISSVSASMSGFQYRVFLNKNGNSCGKYSNPATLTTWALPTIITPVTLKQCDDDTDGISVFNLTEANRIISPINYLVETFSFFTNQTAADTNNTAFLITNPTAYTSSSTTTTPLWVRIVNAKGCFKVAQLNLIVSVTAINSTTFTPRVFTKCDDYIDAVNNDTDGITEFNFSSVTSDIRTAFSLSVANYSIKYYRKLSDAQAEINEITNTTTYRNIGYPNQQDIFVRIDSNLDNACFGMDKLVKLVVEKLPVFNTVGIANTIRKCDDNNDGLLTVGFNTSTLESQILNGQNPATKSFLYFDAVSGLPLPSPLPNPFVVVNSTSVRVRINNVGGVSPACFTEKVITFIVDTLPQNFANLINPTTLVVCDDEADPLLQNGLNAFDTSSFNSTILGSQTGMVLTYTNSSGTVLTNIGGTAPFVTSTQTIFATVSNPLNNSCPARYSLNFIVKPLPRVKILGNEEMVCKNLPNLRVTLDAGITDGSSPSLYTYVWTKDGLTLSDTTESISVNTEGTYTVTVKNSVGCSATRTIKVFGSSNATTFDVDIDDLADISTVNVTVTSGSGKYRYALDDTDNYQTSGFFNNVSIGFHTVYINDLLGCGTVTKTIAVLGAPRFFTPNNDGFNDYWNIKGTNRTFNFKTSISIFNRFGILLKQITPGNIGWDGNFDGKPVPADDYWYIIEAADGRSAKGHFTLKR